MIPLPNAFRLLLFTLSLNLFCSEIQAFQLRIELGDEREFRLQSNTFLFGHHINQRALIDSSFSNNSIVFELSDKLPKGLYSVMIYTDMKDAEDKYQRLGFDVILSGVDVMLNVEVKPDHTFGMVDASNGENFGYYRHFNTNLIRFNRIKAIQQAIMDYPEGNEFHARMVNHEKELQQELDNASSSIQESAKYPIAEFYFQCQQSVQNRSLDKVNFADPLFKNSQYIPVFVGEYLAEEDNLNLSLSTRNQMLFTRLNNLISKLKVDQEVYARMLPQLVSDYERLGRHEVVLHLNEKYALETSCENPEALERIKSKNESLKKVLLGEVAPDFSLGEFNVASSLHSILSKHTLVVFWESTCPHCQDLTSQLAKFYDPNRRFELEVVAVSLDSSITKYDSYLSLQKWKWLNINEPKGWDSDVVSKYSIASTPSLFLLDKQKRIVAKPRSVEELKSYLSTLEK